MCVSTARINRLPTVFKHPNAYLPERRLDDNDDLFRDIESSSQDRGLVNKTSLTFSRGAHPCLGMNLAYLKMRVAISCLVKHFEFTYNGPVSATSGLIVSLRNKLLVEFRPQVL
jgi:cytochrome P450